ncbi:hypothetical protein BRIN106911_14810 [Brevibacillus invocatus]
MYDVIIIVCSTLYIEEIRGWRMRCVIFLYQKRGWIW